MLKNREGHHSDDAVKKGEIELRCARNLRCASLRSALQRCGALSSDPIYTNPIKNLPRSKKEQTATNRHESRDLRRPGLSDSYFSKQGKLPTELIPLENYLEIGNGLPNRKNCFGELFGPVMELNR